MPASQPAGRKENSGDKRETGTLRFRQFLSPTRRDPIVAVLNLFDEATIDEFRQSHTDIRPGFADVLCQNRRALDRQLLGVVEPGQDPVISLSHPVGQIPDFHGYRPVLAGGSLGSAYSDVFVQRLNGIVSSFIGVASRHDCNDRPGALGGQDPGRGRSPRPGGRTTTTMKSDNADGLSSRPSTEAMRVIERADAAYHDVAQYHLHEFSGGGGA
jgi:hypothetical protein